MTLVSFEMKEVLWLQNYLPYRYILDVTTMQNGNKQTSLVVVTISRASTKRRERREVL